MPITTVTFETPLAVLSMQQMARDFSSTSFDGSGDCPQIALPCGGTARLQASETGFTVTLISDDPAVIARSKRLVEGYFEQMSAGLKAPPSWIDSDA